MNALAERFPVLLSYDDPRYGQARCSVPWDAVAPHERQAQRNHLQPLRRLAERGGLGWRDLLLVLTDAHWAAYDLARGGWPTEQDAEAKVRALVEVQEEEVP